MHAADSVTEWLVVQKNSVEFKKTDGPYLRMKAANVVVRFSEK